MTTRYKNVEADPDDDDLDLNGHDAYDTALTAGFLFTPEQDSTDGRRFLTLPADFQLVELPDDKRLPHHAQAAVTVDDRESLTRYINRFQTADTIIMADYDALAIHGLIDWHPANDSDQTGTGGACRHTATLKLRSSEEFARWNEMAKRVFVKQAEFAAFLEENAVDIVEPAPAVMIEISRDLETTTSMGFKSSSRLESGDRKFLFETDTRVENGVIIPREFRVHIPLYQGEDPETLRAAFRYRPTSDGLLLGFEWRRVEYQRQAHFAAIAHAVAEATGRPVLLGRQAGG